MMVMEEAVEGSCGVGDGGEGVVVVGAVMVLWW